MRYEDLLAKRQSLAPTILWALPYNSMAGGSIIGQIGHLCFSSLSTSTSSKQPYITRVCGLRKPYYPELEFPGPHPYYRVGGIGESCLLAREPVVRIIICPHASFGDRDSPQILLAIPYLCPYYSKDRAFINQSYSYQKEYQKSIGRVPSDGQWNGYS